MLCLLVDGTRRLVTYKEWDALIQRSFEKCYYVPVDPANDKDFVVNSSLVNRRGIYKDVFGSGQGREWSDYQFRPNFPIAMTVAPELFTPERALGALKLADTVLRSRLGMMTLDPEDMQYRPNYDNSDDSTDPAIAKGRNYHQVSARDKLQSCLLITQQGPEWGWPLGYFLRAYLYFDTRAGAGTTDKGITLHHLHTALLPARAGIPELTNQHGAHCHDSCASQAWSASALLDALEDVHQVTST